jgi:hypothetical protein
MGLLRHLIQDLILNKINKMAAFFHLLLVHIVGFHRILYSCPINPSDVEHKENQCNGQPNNNNNNSNNPVNLEQLIAM